MLQANHNMVGALVADREAVNLFRLLVESVSTQHTVGLADALNNLGSDLLGVGHPREALAALQEAVALLRRLVEHEPAPYAAKFAQALGNLGHSLWATDQRPEALAALQDALARFRLLVRNEPAATPLIWSAGSTFAA